MSLKIECYPNGPLSENTYLITDEATGHKAIIDPGYYGMDVTSAIGDAGSLKYVLLTHGHYDHFAAAELYLTEYPDAVFEVPAHEEYLLSGGRDNKWMALGKGSSICPKADVYVKEGDTITLGETVLRVIETPGHTEGGICFATEREVFTGDTLFRLSVGNTSLETGDWETMENSILSKLYTLPEEMIVLPGHGPATTIGYEKRANPFV
ncbi:MAG: MBL fold metallo-hydrolase [Mogibacterium sp.]|nr:MBL fold metallo-hydrolase [Mogibacterium sp.]